MTTFDDRKKAFEKKFEKDLDLQFKVECRACKNFGMYIAGEIGLECEDACTYALEVVTVNLDEPGLDDVLRKVRADLDAKNVDIPDHKLKIMLEHMVEEAKHSIMEESSS